MLERTMRRRSGVEKVASVRVGRISAAQLSQPETGRSRSWTAKRRMSMMPVQKTGIEVPRKTARVAPWSKTEFRRTALRMPIGRAMARERPIASTVSSSVVGMRSSTSGRAGARWKKELPKLPRAVLARKRENWTGRGSLKPMAQRRGRGERGEGGGGRGGGGGGGGGPLRGPGSPRGSLLAGGGLGVEEPEP